LTPQSNYCPVVRLAAVALVAVGSCSKHHPDPDSVAIGRKAVASLARTFRAVGLEASEQGSTVSVAGKRIGVEARINNRGQTDDRSILAAEFDILVDGIRIPTLTAGVVGVDDTAEHARDTAAAEWAGQYGAPIGFALATRFGASGGPSPTDKIAPFYAKLEIEGQVLFHGPPGLRGDASTREVSSDGFVRTLATSVVPILLRTPPVSEYRSATVMVVVKGTAVTGGECRIDGVVSPELLQALSKLAWPEASPSYMFKLFFVGIPGHV
jgi:hypothetical protein